MIVTEMKPFGEIKAQLKKEDKIGIVSCNACARRCDTGGKENMEILAKRLEKEGFNVVDMNLIGIVCDFDQLNQLKKDELHSNVIIALACDAGVYNLKKLFPKRKIIAALTTIGLAAFDEKGDIYLVRKF